MDIPALSMALSHNKVTTQISISLMKKTLELAEQQGTLLTEMLSQASVPAGDSTIDLSV